MSRHKSGEGYQKTILQHWSSPDYIGLHHSLMEEVWNHQDSGRLEKLSNRGRRVLVRVVTKNPMVTLTELQSSSVEMGNLPEGQPSLQHSTNQAFIVVARRKPLLSKRHMTACLEFTKRHIKTLRPWETRFSGLLKPRLNSLAWMPSVTSGGNLAPSLWWRMVVAASCCGDVFQRHRLRD